MGGKFRGKCFREAQQQFVIFNNLDLPIVSLAILVFLVFPNGAPEWFG